MALNKIEKRNKIRTRVRSKIKGTADRPRLSVFKSNKGIYAQVINDEEGVTIASASTNDKVMADVTGNKSEMAKAVGTKVAELAKAKGIESVSFDRGGYLYHGRIKSLAEAAREAGLKF
jgi:large subunit ribosomal protein L18